jgi:hypothetical protein
MRGTKVQWIYCHEWASDIVRTIHRAGITKAYSPLAPIDSGHDSVDAASAFIEHGLTALANSPILGKDRAVVDAYLPAKVEHDFLETRASKIALAIEKLKHAFLQSGMSQVEEFIADDAEFKKLVPSVMDAAVRAMEAGGIPSQKARLIAAYGKIYGFNRTGFRGVLKGLCKASGCQCRVPRLSCFLSVATIWCTLGASIARQPPLRIGTTCSLCNAVRRILLSDQFPRPTGMNDQR